MRMKPLPLPLLELSAPCPPLCEQRQRLAKLVARCNRKTVRPAGFERRSQPLSGRFGTNANESDRP
jgi:hypothetical protein